MHFRPLRIQEKGGCRTLDTAPDQVVRLETGECLEEVPVEEPEQQEVRGDGGLADLEVLQPERGDGGEEAGHVVGVPGGRLDGAVGEGGVLSQAELEVGQETEGRAGFTRETRTSQSQKFYFSDPYSNPILSERRLLQSLEIKYELDMTAQSILKPLDLD